MQILFFVSCVSCYVSHIYASEDAVSEIGFFLSYHWGPALEGDAGLSSIFPTD